MVKKLLVMAALLLAALALPALAQEYPPPPQGAVLDQANIIPADQEAALDQRLRNYNAQTGRAVIVATVNTLDGLPASQYAQELAERWNIGGAETEMGVLMLVAPNDREVFITTARGVQGVLTDISSGRIVRDTILPAFRNGDYAGGISAGVDAIVARLAMDPVDARAVDEAEAAAEKQNSAEGGIPVGGLIWLGFIVFFFILPMMRAGGRRRRFGSPTGNIVGDIVLWEAGKAISRGSSHGSWGGGGFGGSGGGGGGFGGFGGGGGGFNGGGAGGSW